MYVYSTFPVSATSLGYEFLATFLESIICLALTANSYPSINGMFKSEIIKQYSEYYVDS